MFNRRDLIVVGAGPAGCLLTHQLVSRFGRRVTLIESPAASPHLPANASDHQRPARWLNLLRSDDDWAYSTVPAESLAGRTIAWPRGRGPGGSSRLNAMIWFPPTEDDFQRLARVGGQHWSIDRLRAAYETAHDLVRPEQPVWYSEATRRFLEAAAGCPHSQPMLYRRSTRRGRRWTAASLLEQLDPNRFELVRGHVDRLRWRDRRVVGVELQAASSERCDMTTWDKSSYSVAVDEAGSERFVDADHGVVLCAGTIATPAILMRSGIGNADHLRQLGIERRIQCDAVGQGLQDHLVMPVIFAVPEKERFLPGSSVREIASWQVLGSGRLASNLAEAGGLFQHGQIQVHVTPTHYLSFPQANAAAAMTIGVDATAPGSRGAVRLASADALTAPTIKPNYLADPADLAITLQGIELARSIAQQSPLRGWIGRELIPGSQRSTAAQLTKTIRRYAQTLYHPTSTCRMGRLDQSGQAADPVVTPDLRVRDVENLWVADASILPSITSGNPQATVMTIGVHAAGIVNESLAPMIHRGVSR